MMEMLGRHRIDAWIGEGAMAEVYRAYDTGLDRAVAIKVLKPAFRHDPDIARRFVQGARDAMGLHHPHIAAIVDAGEADGVAYIAMDLIDGLPLDAVLRAGGRMPGERVLTLGLQIADAIACVHRAGILHRDLKPAGILLADDGRSAMLVDIGIAREAPGASTQRAGTLRYASPERFLGRTVDARADLFSLGAILYEMVTGRTAFPAVGAAALADQVTHAQPPAIEQTVPDCPRDLRVIVERLLAKAPEQRFADADALALAMRRALAPPAAARGRRWRLPTEFWLPIALAGATALLLASGVWTTLDREAAALDRDVAVSGATITAFVAGNAAVDLADNAGLPAAAQDWVPLQASVDTAARDDGVASLVVADAAGIVRAASDHRLIGLRRVAPADEAIGGNGLRFGRTIRYAGIAFGQVDLVLRRTALDAALSGARAWLIALALLLTAAAAGTGALAMRAVVRPLRRLRDALAAIADGDLSTRIAHDRTDAVGAVFDAFNRAVDAIEPRLADADACPAAPAPMRQAA